MKYLTISVLIFISLTDRCFAKEFFRDHIRNPDNIVNWENPNVSQASAATSSRSGSSGGGDLPALAATSEALAQQFDERVADHIAKHVLHFGYNIGQLLTEHSQHVKTEVFSPMSIMSSLALLMLGAKGKSYQQLKQVFGFDHDIELDKDPSKFHNEFGRMVEDAQWQNVSTLPHNRKKPNWQNTEANSSIRGKDSKKPIEHIVKIANGLFAQDGYSLNLDYRNTIQSVYRSDLVQLDFLRKTGDARDYINRWVAQNTFGKIPIIIDDESVLRGAKVILANALYFKGFWEYPFFHEATVLDNFYPDGNKNAPLKVQMMATGGTFPYYDSPEYDCRIIGLPYRGELTTMYVIQPNNSNRAKLKELQKNLDANKIEELISKMVRKSGVLVFPKLHIVKKLDLKDKLIRLGIDEIFSSSLSDLSLIAKQQDPSAFSSGVQQSWHQGQSRPFVFSRFGEQTKNSTLSNTTVHDDGVHSVKSKRQAVYPLIDRSLLKKNSLLNLEAQRIVVDAIKSDLFVDDIYHKVDFDVNEEGTEAAAATLTTLKRSGTDIQFRADAPFMLLIRHDPTKLVLFYGIINEPELREN